LEGWDLFSFFEVVLKVEICFCSVKNLNLPNYLNEQKQISTIQTTSLNKNISQPSKLPHWTKIKLHFPNYLNEQKQISTIQTTSLNKNKSQPSKLPQRTKTNLNLPNYLTEQKQISTFQTTSMNKNISQPKVVWKVEICFCSLR
jgi:hypothetical protein